jgi:hypothetical protein
MTNRTVSAGPAPRIVIDNVGGDLSIVGWEGEDILIKADEDETRFKQDASLVTVSSSDDLSLRVPRGANLTIQAVGGDMALRGVMGNVEIKTIGGDASIRDINNASIDTISSDLSMRNVKGNLMIKNVGSDASIREVQGNVSLESVGDDLVLRDVRGNLKANVGADVVLSFEPQAGNNYAVNAGDDVMLILPPDASAKLAMNGDEIIVDWPGIPYEEDLTSQTLTLGSGASNISLNAGGELRVSSQEKAQQSPDEFGNFAGMMFDWPDFGNQLSARITQRVEEATRRAAQTAERAARRAEAKLRGPRARGKVEVGRWNWNIEPGSFTPPAPREPVSEEERVVILKMLAEKKITADEADKLLTALDGGR